MKNSETGTEVYGKVEYVSGTRLWIKYYNNGDKFRIELPRTQANIHLIKGDKIKLAILLLKD